MSTNQTIAASVSQTRAEPTIQTRAVFISQTRAEPIRRIETVAEPIVEFGLVNQTGWVALANQTEWFAQVDRKRVSTSQMVTNLIEGLP